MTQHLDVERLANLIEDAAIRYAGGCPVDFRPTAKEIAAIVLHDAAKICDEIDEGWGIEAYVQCAAAIRALAEGVRHG